MEQPKRLIQRVPRRQIRDLSAQERNFFGTEVAAVIPTVATPAAFRKVLRENFGDTIYLLYETWM